MRSTRSEIERLVPALRQFARALVEGHRSDVADDLVHEAVEDTLRAERSWGAGEIERRLYGRLIRANRSRVQAEPHRAISGGASQVDQGRRPQQGVASRGPGLDRLPLGDREALLLSSLARLDYASAAEVLNLPVATLIVRLAHARDTLGPALWAGSSSKSRQSGVHLRLVRPGS